MGRKILPKEVKCDVCGKILSRIRFNSNLIMYQEDEDKELQNQYWRLNIGDYSDPINNIETYTLCSKKCIDTKYNEYIDRSIDNKDGIYFELRHEETLIK